MNKNSMRALGFNKEVDAFEKQECPHCGKKINPDTEFRDELSKKQFYVSGFCQQCQDNI